MTSSDNARQYYDRHSEEYVAKWSSIDEEPAGVYRRHTIENLLDVAGVREGTRVAEIGAGTGLVLRALLERTRPVVGTDVSVEMLHRAQEALSPQHRVALVERLPEDPWSGDQDVYLVQNDLMRLELPAGAFDVLLAMEVLRYVADQPAALRNVAAVMGPETVFAFTITNLWSAGLFPLKFELRRRLGRIDGANELLQYFVTEGSLRRMLREAGLEVVELRRLHCAAFNPVARKLVGTRAGAERVVELDRRLERLPVVNRCFDTLLVAARRR